MHKKDKKKVFNILVIPDDQKTPPKNFRIRYSIFKVAVTFLFVVTVLIIYGILTYSQVLQEASAKKKQDKELLQLKEQLKRVSILQSRLDSVMIYRDKVRRSLQGYVQFAERVDDELLSAKNLDQIKLNKNSIFTSVPLKTPVTGFVSQEFKKDGHSGIDIVAPIGTPIVSAADGTIVFSGWTYENGYVIVIYHNRGYLTFYRHNSQNLVSVNQNIKQGDVIAFLGNSGGTSSGPHLHFEIWKDGKPLNPRQFLLDINNSGE